MCLGESGNAIETVQFLDPLAQFGGALLHPALQFVVGLSQCGLGSFAFDGIYQRVRQQRTVHFALGQVILCPGADRVAGHFYVPVPGQHDDGHARRVGVQAGKGRVGLAVGQVEVEQHGVECPRLQSRQRVAQRADRQHVELRQVPAQCRGGAEQRLDQPGVVGVVFH